MEGAICQNTYRGICVKDSGSFVKQGILINMRSASVKTDIEWHDPTGNLAVLHVMLEKMRNRIKALPDRQKRLIMYRYGLSIIECKTISETAAFFNLTERYAAEIEKKTLKTLRDGMNDGKIVWMILRCQIGTFSGENVEIDTDHLDVIDIPNWNTDNMNQDSSLES